MSDIDCVLSDERASWSGDKMIRVANKTFCCDDCGANVFKSRLNDPLRYRCNGCGAMYRGEGLDE